MSDGPQAVHHGAEPRRAVSADLLDAMIRPRSLAVLGASSGRSAQGNQALANLRAAGFGGPISVVHRSAATVDGIDAVPAIEDLPRDLDVALVSLPAASVVDALTRLEAIGCRSAVVPSGGLGPLDRLAIRELADRGAMAVHGPNSLGLLNLTDGVPLVFWSGWLTREPPGNVALVAQSGGAAVGVVKSTERARFSKIIASGNEWGVTSADYLSWLAQDSSTEAVGIVLESIADADRFADAVSLLREAGTPLVVLKVGRSAGGAALAAAHTAGLIGQAEGYTAFFDELDVPVVRDYDELSAALDAFSAVRSRRPRRTGVAVITESGGIAALAADVAQSRGIDLAGLDDATKTALRELLPGAVPLNPFDSGASPDWTGERFEAAIGLLARDPNVGVVVAVADAQSTLTDDEVAHEVENFEAIAAAARANPATPVLVASSTSMTTHPRWRDCLGDDVAVVRGLTPGLAAASALTRNTGPVAPGRRPEPAAGAPEWRRLLGRRSGQLPADEARSLLGDYGIPMAASLVATTAAEAVGFAQQVGFPVVAKVASPDIAHRSDIGAVITGVEDADALEQAIDTIRRRVDAHDPAARVDGVEIQEQVSSRLEAMVGFVCDPVFGPIVSVGLGGVLVELVGDRAFGLAPLTPERARVLVERTWLAALASGYRGLVPPTPLDGLADCVARFSRLASDLRSNLVAGELNPVLVREGTGEVCAVDSLFLASSPTDRKDTV